MYTGSTNSSKNTVDINIIFDLKITILIATHRENKLK